MKKLLFIAVIPLLWAFGASAKSEDGEFLFILKGRGNVFWKTVREGIEETSKARGIKSIILNTDDDQTPEAQLNICTASLSRKPKVLVLGAATKNVGIECFKKAAQEGVLSADIDGNVTLEDAALAKVPLAFSVGSDNALIGKSAAEYVARVNTIKSPSILILKGLPGSIVSEKRAQGFLEEIQRAIPEAKIVGTPTTDWDRLKAMNITVDFLQRESTIDYIFSVSDAMSLGAAEGLRVSAKADRVKLLSVDGIADARKAIMQNRMLADVAQLPYFMGKRAVELAIAASKGEVKNYNEFTPIPVLTKEVLERKDDPNLQFLR